LIGKNCSDKKYVSFYRLENRKPSYDLFWDYIEKLGVKVNFEELNQIIVTNTLNEISKTCEAKMPEAILHTLWDKHLPAPFSANLEVKGKTYTYSVSKLGADKLNIKGLNVNVTYVFKFSESYGKENFEFELAVSFLLTLLVCNPDED
jgi:hypothetical protein